MVGYTATYPGISFLNDNQCCDTSIKESTEFDSSHWDQETYMRDQCQEICIHKWIESQKAGYDIGTTASRDWINKYAKSFREYAMKSGKYFK